MTYDVFICHASEDKSIADGCCSILESKGIRCWIAPRDILPGMDWSSQIVEAINTVRIIVIIYTARSNESQQVKREVERGVNRGLPIIPIRIEDVQLSKHMEYFISTPHWLDALTPPLEAHFNHLAVTVKRLLEQAAVKSQPLSETPEAHNHPAAVRGSGTWLDVETQLLEKLYPMLRIPGTLLRSERHAIPWVAAILSLLVGILGLLANTVGFFRALSPSGNDALFYGLFGAFRSVNLLGAVINLIGTGLLVIAARRMFVKAGGGPRIAVSASLLLAVWTLVWLALANRIVLSSEVRLPPGEGVLPAIYGLAALSLLQVGTVWFFARREP